MVISSMIHAIKARRNMEFGQYWEQLVPKEAPSARVRNIKKRVLRWRVDLLEVRHGTVGGCLLELKRHKNLVPFYGGEDPG